MMQPLRHIKKSFNVEARPTVVAKESVEAYNLSNECLEEKILKNFVAGYFDRVCIEGLEYVSNCFHRDSGSSNFPRDGGLA